MTQLNAPEPLELPSETRAALEWDALLAVLSRECRSEPGRLRLERLRPAPDLETARAEQRVLAEALDLDRLGISHPIRRFPEIGPLLQRVARGGAASASELSLLRDLLGLARELRGFAKLHREHHGTLAERLESPAELDELGTLLETMLDPDGGVADRASPELREARRRARDSRDELKKRLAALLERYADVLSGDYTTEREGRHVLPVRSDAHLRVPGIVLGSSASGATLYVEPEELLGLGNRLRVQEAEALRAEAKILSELSRAAGERADAIRVAFEACIFADTLAARVTFARRARAIAVELAAEPELLLRDARHPLLAVRLPNVVANDVTAVAGQALVISGPNAGGKTVALKTLGLVAWMARAGLPVTVAPESRVGWFEEVLADVGDEQSLSRSLSTFSAHVERLRDTLAVAQRGTLVLLDELASGTDPEEGAALAAAVLERLTEQGAAVAVTTHYERLKEFAAHAPHLSNASVSYDFERMAPTFRLTLGVPGASSALTVAERHGLPPAVVERARSILPVQSHERELAVERLERERARLEELRLDLERDVNARREEARRQEEEGAARREAFERELSEQTRALQSNVARVRAELHAARERLRAGVHDLRELKALERDVSRAAQHVALGGSLVPRGEPVVAAPLESTALRGGQSVRVESTGAVGTVLEQEGARVRLQVGGLKLTLRREDVTAIDAVPSRPKPSRAAKRARSEGPLPTAVRTTDNTLDLRGQRVDEALGLLDAFMDRLTGSGAVYGFALHGHGTGALKAKVREHLASSSYVERVAPADADSGGDAFTVFWLRE